MRRGAGERAKAKKTEAFGEIFPRFLESLEKKKEFKFYYLLYHWEEIVGKTVALHVKPVRMDFGKLFLSADTPVWANEISYMEGKVKDRINSFMCEEFVKSVGFCAGEEKCGVMRKKESLTIESPPIIPKKDDEEKAAAFLGEIKNEALKEAAFRALSQSVAKRRTREEEGWRACPRCKKILVSPDEKECFLCERERKSLVRKKIRGVFMKEPWLRVREVCRLTGFEMSDVKSERESMLRMTASRVRSGDTESRDALRLIMMFFYLRPEEINGKIKDKALRLLRFDVIREEKSGKKEGF